MSHEVYANSNEIAARSGMSKVIAAFPDVCLSPPSPPAGPIPIPYPDTSFSSDLKEGSQTVKLGGEPAALAQQSYYQPSVLGDEAATRALGMNVITHQITGKTYFQSWSMDVKIEGKNVCRHVDLTTSNHASGPGGVPNPFPSLEAQALIQAGQCPCCTGPLHSPEQSGTPMTEQQWYEPNYPSTPPRRHERQAIEYAKQLREEAREIGCDYLLHDDASDPCALHYAVKSAQPRRDEYNAMMSPLTPPDEFSNRYGTKLGAEIQQRGVDLNARLGEGATGIAHRTPLAGGGCPVGAGNLLPVYENCAWLESELGGTQGIIKEYHVRALGL